MKKAHSKGYEWLIRKYGYNDKNMERWGKWLYRNKRMQYADKLINRGVIVNVQCTKNNNIASAAYKGTKIICISGGQISKKNRAKKGDKIGMIVGKKARRYNAIGIVKITGWGIGREGFIRGLKRMMIVGAIRDCNREAHNGCRGKKERRL